jgi:hypothetical protein
MQLFLAEQRRRQRRHLQLLHLPFLTNYYLRHFHSLPHLTTGDYPLSPAPSSAKSDDVAKVSTKPPPTSPYSLKWLSKQQMASKYRNMILPAKTSRDIAAWLPLISVQHLLFGFRQFELFAGVLQYL